MTDFLDSLVQRSLSTVDQARSGRALAPRLPGLFEPTGDDALAPVGPPFAQQLPAPEVDMGPGIQNIHAPHRSVVPPERISTSSLHIASHTDSIKEKMSTGGEGVASEEKVAASSIPASIIRSQAIRHETEQVPPQHEHPLMPLPPLRWTADLYAAAYMNRQQERAENAAAMIERPSQTTVRISIGRIEVRAVQPPQPGPQARRTTAPAKLTIEEYAKQRNEGKS